MGQRVTVDSILEALFARATDAEATFLRAVLTRGLRQGALGGVVASAAAKAFGVKLGSIRRAAMLLGDLGEAAEIAARSGEEGLSAVGLVVGRAIQPMLASTAGSIGEALEHTGRASVEWKLDGIRIQVHKAGQEVRVFSRNLNDITNRTGAVVDVVRSFSAEHVVLDGEVLGSEPHFFDILHIDGEDLLDTPTRGSAGRPRIGRGVAQDSGCDHRPGRGGGGPPARITRCGPRGGDGQGPHDNL